MVFDSRPQVLPVAMDVSGTERSEIWSMTRAGVVQRHLPNVNNHLEGGLAEFVMSGVGGGSTGRSRDGL